MTDSPQDTALARLVHREQRVDLETLKLLLEEARRARAAGGPASSLADLLVARGLLRGEEAAGLLRQIARGVSERLTRPLGSSGQYLTQSGEGEGWRTGALVGGLRLVQALGRGAMGMVWVAEDPESGARRAIKVTRETDPAALERFRREGEAQARVDAHPNVTRVHGTGEHAGHPYLVMELVEGETLAERVHKRGPMEPREAARLAAALADGLAHLHARGVVHRDLKPANVLIDAEDVPKLADFGLARVSGTSRLTLTGELVGTPTFMAPEQALGQQERVGPPADVYALGAVLFVLLTGREPFPGQTTIDVIDQAVNRPPPSPRSLAPDVPPALDALVLRALEKAPQARPSARELADALARLARSDEAPASPPGRGRLLLALAGAAGLSLVLVVGALVWTRPAPATPAPPPVPVERAAPPPPPPKEPFLLWPWKAGQVRRVEIRLDTSSSFNWGNLAGREGPFEGRRMGAERHSRYSGTWQAREVAEGRARLVVQIDAVSVSSRGGRRWTGAFDQDSARGDKIAAMVGSGFELTLDMRTGAIAEVAGVTSLAAAARQAGLMDDEVLELIDPAVTRSALERVTLLLPPGEDEPRGTWKVARSWTELSRFWLDAPPAALEVQARRGRALELSWSGEAKASLRGGARPASGMISGEATLGPGGLERTQVREAWRDEHELFSLDVSCELRVLGAAR